MRAGEGSNREIYQIRSICFGDRIDDAGYLAGIGTGQLRQPRVRSRVRPCGQSQRSTCLYSSTRADRRPGNAIGNSWSGRTDGSNGSDW